MSQSWFRFRQFTIHQDKCAMKVSTTACIQGAWTPIPTHATNVLDIGAGTGLLSLMLAQRNQQINIDALEIDADAAGQAAENIAASPFADRIHVVREDANLFNPAKAYDLIICNPPFFTNDLKGPDSNRNAVRHDDHLSAPELAAIANRCISENGVISVLWPERRMPEWEELMKRTNWHLHHALAIRHTAGARVSTVASTWSPAPAAHPSKEELTIYNGPAQYSPEATALLKDFYLKL